MIKAIIGAGGFANEVKAQMNDFYMPCFVDDKYYKENESNIHPISKFNSKTYQVIVAIGDPKARKKVIESLPKDTKYFSFMHPSAQILGDDNKIGLGAIICANVIITTNVKIGNHCHLNLATTIGHDCVIGDYFTTAPGAKISGNCNIGNSVYIGTNASVKEKIKICDNVTIGLNAGVVKDIKESGTYVGVPSKLLKLNSVQ